MGAFSRAHDSGTVAGLRRALVLIENEVVLPGPMPWRLRLLSIISPTRAVRASCLATKRALVRSVLKEIETIEEGA